MSLAEIFENVDDDWVDLLDGVALEKILDELSRVPPATITPPMKNMFNFARLTPLDSVRVVIIGQDPYPTAGHAHGLAFSCLGTIPSSLVQIYKCLEKQKLISRPPKTGDLTRWARQGVLLLNRALTNIVGDKRAHSRLWSDYTRDLTTKIIQHAAAKGNTLIFILWGADAKQLSTAISRHANCKILEYTHPSPIGGRTFVDCPNFADCNKLLAEMKQPTVDWNVEDGLSTKSFDEVVGYNDEASASYAVAVVEAAIGMGKDNDGINSYAIYFHTKGAIRNKCVYGKMKRDTRGLKGAYFYGVSRALDYIAAAKEAKEVSEIILLVQHKHCSEMFYNREEMPQALLEKYSDIWQEIDKKIEESGKNLSIYYAQSYETAAFPKENFNNFFTSEMLNYASAMAQYVAGDDTIVPGTETEE